MGRFWTTSLLTSRKPISAKSLAHIVPSFYEQSSTNVGLSAVEHEIPLFHCSFEETLTLLEMEFKFFCSTKLKTLIWLSLIDNCQCCENEIYSLQFYILSSRVVTKVILEQILNCSSVGWGLSRSGCNSRAKGNKRYDTNKIQTLLTTGAYS